MLSAFRAELAASGPLMDKDAFRAVVSRVRQQTGLKGRPLLHPVRLALTGEPEGIELDIAVPAIERGAALGAAAAPAIPGAAERVDAFARELHRRLA
jgi:hypothetical protein